MGILFAWLKSKRSLFTAAKLYVSALVIRTYIEHQRLNYEALAQLDHKNKTHKTSDKIEADLSLSKSSF